MKLHDRKNGAHPSVDLVSMLELEGKRKSNRRGSFITKDAIPNRSIVEDNKIVDFLRSEGFTIGLARTLIRNTDCFPARIWLVDNSVSMNLADGHRVKQDYNKITNISCTRWEEVTSTIMWHANFAAMMKAPTAVRLMHPIGIDHSAAAAEDGTSVGAQQQAGIASAEHVDAEAELKRLHEMLAYRPCGTGGQAHHLREVVDSCLQTPMDLLKNRSMAILYVTDRLPCDENGNSGEHVTKSFVETLNRLQGLPVWFVIRLSTDDQQVVDFYEDLDNKISYVNVDSESEQEDGQIHLDVLDDYVSEAEAVNKHNPWLNYALPLHLCRESGVNFPVFDALNDRPLTHDEVVQFLNLLFDRTQTAWAQQPIANPNTHYADFRAEVGELNKKAGSLYNPIKRRCMPWLDMTQVDRIYGGQGTVGCSCSIM